jgi:hypothetical protein
MKKRLLVPILLVMALFLILPQQPAGAQGLRIIASNTAMGALNGAMLGGASMALANSDDLRPLRFGVGFGTLAGLGLGIHDLVQAHNGQYMINGVFNRANYTSQIILLDTFYGAAIGTMVGVAVTMIMDEKLIYGLQYGVGVGTWVGIAFGLLDAFAISSGPREFRYEDFDEYSSGTARQRSLLQLETGSRHTFGFAEIGLMRLPDFSSANNRVDVSPVITVASWEVRF